MTKKTGPVLIELDKQKRAKAVKPMVPPMKVDVIATLDEPFEGRAMQAVTTIAARRTSPLAKWLFRLLAALFTFAVSLWVWDFATGLLERNVVLGCVAITLLSLVLLVILAIALKEWVAFSRLRKLDDLRNSADTALQEDNLEQARATTTRLVALYRDRPELKWSIDNLTDRRDEVLDAEGLLAVAEQEVVAKLDAQAEQAVQAAARQVATVTAIVPIALADVVTALFSNIRMIRQIAEIYSGRSGTLGSWRLTRAVFAHLVATAAVAVGDDLIGSLAGGGMLSKVSRRFGEGVINGALTARVGLAAMDVCRPLPFIVVKKPGVSSILRQALAGLFSGK